MNLFVYAVRVSQEICLSCIGLYFGLLLSNLIRTIQFLLYWYRVTFPLRRHWHLSYPGTSVCMLCRQTSVVAIPVHRVTAVATSRESLHLWPSSYNHRSFYSRTFHFPIKRNIYWKIKLRNFIQLSTMSYPFCPHSGVASFFFLARDV